MPKGKTAPRSQRPMTTHIYSSPTQQVHDEAAQQGPNGAAAVGWKVGGLRWRDRRDGEPWAGSWNFRLGAMLVTSLLNSVAKARNVITPSLHESGRFYCISWRGISMWLVWYQWVRKYNPLPGRPANILNNTIYYRQNKISKTEKKPHNVKDLIVQTCQNWTPYPTF